MKQAFLPLFAVVLLGSAGCELISNVDRSKITENDAGIGGSGGTGGAVTTTGGSGGKTSTGGSGGTMSTGGTGGMTTGGTGGMTTGGTGGMTTGGTGGMGTGGTGPTCTTTSCTAVGDCPVPTTECVTATCDMGCCGTTNVADLTATTGGQTSKDCKLQVCDGAGAEKLVNDDNDLPDGSDACHVGTCTAGVQGQAPKMAGTTCAFNGGKVCDSNGACVGCLVDNDCAGNPTNTLCDTAQHICIAPTCTDNAQNGSETDKDCGGSCPKCADTLNCMQASDCLSGVCTAGKCAAPTCTDTAQNGTETDLNCGGATCVAQGKTCTVGQKCTAASDCDTGACNGVTCVYKAQGLACASNNECGAAGSNLCVDGVCCNTSCTNGCMACSAAKKGSGGDGVCGNIVAGNDPKNNCTAQAASTCGDTGVCDGSGACQKFAAGTTCRAAAVGGCDVAETCPGGGAACPADGFAANTTVCRAAAPGGCDVAETCTGASAACPADAFLPNTTVCRAAAPGGCDVAESCTGASAACPTDAFQPSSVVCRAAAPGGCDVPESCTGSTATCPTDAFASSTTDCGSTCTSGTETPKTCNGSGTCVTGSPNTCTNGCNAGGTACSSPCVNDTNCPPGNFCNAGSCAPKLGSGAVCGGNNQCNSNTCGTAGTGNCCASACSTVGVCGATACDAAGACVGPGSGTACGSVCTGNTLVLSACTGTGTCAAGAPSACAAGLICADATSCKTACAADTDCASATDYCMNPGASGMCMPKAAAGAPCSGNNECTSTICDVDGSGNCCATTCTTGGTCGATACDAAGACSYPTAATSCGTSCVGNTLTPSACSGTGTCAAGTPAACAGGFICASATACKTTCALDADCATATDYCNAAGACVPELANGVACTGNNQCASTFCGAAGTGNCCATACLGGCDNTGACLVPPSVTSVSPDAPSTPVATTAIAVTFSVAMNPVTLTAQTAAGACTGSIQLSLDNFTSCVAFSSAAPSMNAANTIATLTPQPGLLINRAYKVRVTTAATNSTGVALGAQFTSTGFTTTNPLTTGLSGVVISQVHGGGGNTGAAFKNDFIEIHNRGTAAVNLNGWSVQYAAATGTTWQVTNLTNVTLQPGGFYLIQEGAGTGSQPSLPTPDASGTIAMSGTAGKVALVNVTTALTGACPVGAQIVDMVGFGTTANCFEGTGPTPAPSNALAVLRAAGGCVDNAQNATDFLTGAANPRNTAATIMSCAPSQNESDAALEVDYCAVQFPLSLTGLTAGASQTIYGRIYQLGVTDQMVNPPAGVTAQVGYGPASANPEIDWGWKWFAATHNAGCTDAVASCGAEDEFQASFAAPTTGTYKYAYRFSLDAGATWTYCDNRQGDNGAGANASLFFNLTDLATMTVN